ncbi:MAG: bifunctional hydroxymethylpyrimidine kinase/phosphomethylpyrimidine kinase [Nitrospirae bacterium]|nr:MAG: bifunctional hydroxymethylpyrimidine kinase/phosphomethylpyrimidine kinase [Nitrospirota bacterium]
MKNILTFAGSDPTSGAGVQMDLRVFSRLSVRGFSVINTVTAQNTKEVRSVFPLPVKIIREQLKALFSEFTFDAAKTGMIYSADAVREFSRFVKERAVKHLVVDPVMVSSTGRPLMGRETIEIFKKKLLPLSEVITPNLKEAERLAEMEISGRDDLMRAARKIHQLGPENVVITGGDLKGEWVWDLLFDGADFHWFRARKIKGEFHGTGCCFSAALTVYLSKGYRIKDAVRRARDFVRRAIKGAYSITDGLRLLGI